MSFENFKHIVDLLKPTDDRIGITQLAIGADYNLQSNPDIWKMMEYSRSCNVVPNITCVEVSDETAKQLERFAGAVAISNYDKETCYNSVEKLTSLGMQQINIHQLLSQETIPQIYELLRDVKTDSRLKNLNAIVFLNLKQKGRGVSHNIASFEECCEIYDYCFEHNIKFGMDSCGSTKFLKYLKLRGLEKYEECVEPCESSLFSSYINVESKFFPCSFCENSWQGIDVLNVTNFETIWNHPKTLEFRTNLLNCNRNCPIFKI